MRGRISYPITGARTAAGVAIPSIRNVPLRARIHKEELIYDDWRRRSSQIALCTLLVLPVCCDDGAHRAGRRGYELQRDRPNPQTVAVGDPFADAVAIFYVFCQ